MCSYFESSVAVKPARLSSSCPAGPVIAVALDIFQLLRQDLGFQLHHLGLQFVKGVLLCLC